MRNKIKKINAFTLTETVIYLGIFGFIFVAVMQFFYTISAGNSVASEQNNMQKVSLFINEHINEKFIDVENIDVSNSTFQDDNGVLRLITNTGYMQYSLSNGQIVFDEDGITDFISPDIYSISKFRFDHIEDSEMNVVGIRLEVQIDSKKLNDIFEKIETSYVLDRAIKQKN